MARKALVTFDFPSAPTVGGASTWYVTPTGTNASGTWGISVTGNAGTVTNGVYTTGNQTIGGTKTFSSTISGSVSGNAGTVTNGVYTTGDQNISGKKVMTPTVATGASTEQAFRINPNALAGSPEWRNMFNIQSTYNAGVNGHGFYIKANASNQFELVTDWSTHLRLGVITNGGSAANATAAKYLALTTSAITWDGNALLDAVNYTTYTVTKTGTGASGTWGISITGSSATLTTARTLTIGSTGKTFNGSADVSWTVAEIGAVGTSGNETITGNKTFSGTTALSATSTINGAVIGFRDVPVTISNANTTFALADAGKAFGKDNTTAYTYTIPANGTVAFPIGTVITVFNNNATSNITVAITTDTLRLAGTTTTGSRTIAPFALCTLFKVSSTVWMASGAGVT